ncbi:hypothetical protein EXIGLDRAFT_734781 [Exidia glandulosa HHB12029]|uniref:Uncharacterized protein n=1 Tax=Exidia glandulosa HHB12029 TaxID=1314781 RepID=A0A165K3L9_EXIGL|nr:hypothetical protein EXIGLDRAFT_734781 [Exidia glandulosa HHB12029]
MMSSSSRAIPLRYRFMHEPLHARHRRTRGAYSILLAALLISPHAVASALPQHVLAAPAATDPCTTIAGAKWAAPADVRACLSSFPVNETLRANLVETVSKTILTFHTSPNYQFRAPAPFTNDVHVDFQKEFARIAKQTYPSYFALHQDLQNTIKLARDGHLGYSNLCFDSLFVSFVPFPLVVTKSLLGPVGAIHIAPEAFNVSSAEFADEIAFWQGVRGLSDLPSFNGAQVLLINGLDPWIAVDQNAAVQGSFQAHATRQNAFFASYTLADSGWTYRMGDFAQRSLPLVDSITLTVLKKGKIIPETVTVPFRARIGTGVKAFTDAPTLFAANCFATASTNGRNVNEPAGFAAPPSLPEPGREKVFVPPVAPQDRFRPQNTLAGDEVLFDIALPPPLVPGPATSGAGAMQFYKLDNTTGVLALGSFSGTFNTLQNGLLVGLQGLKAAGATKLIVDVTNNGGGFICIAHWLHRIIAGPNPNSVPQAGLDTKARAQQLAKDIVHRIVDDNADPDNNLLNNPLSWNFPNATAMPADFNWLDPGVPTVVNGRQDFFSVRMMDACQPFSQDPPTEQLFAPENIVIVNNGRCASSCSLFTITMSVHYGVRTVVVGGKPGVAQNYCGTVGGQSVSFVTMDTEVKSVGLKSSALAPPDLLTAATIGLTWRLGFSIRHPQEPEEWQDHPASASFTPSLEIVNNPTAVWTAIAKQFL